MPPSHPARPADDQRQARLDARLALYAQYASLVGDEIAAAWSDDPYEAGAVTRRIAETRAALAEQYAELRASGEAAGVSPEGFGDLLAEAVTEQDHQRAVERALRAQLERLRGGTPLLAAGGAPVDEVEPEPEAAEPVAEPEATEPPIGAALLAARSSGVGGMLAGRYPGIAAGADSAHYVASPAAPVPVPGDGAPVVKLDVRF